MEMAFSSLRRTQRNGREYLKNSEAIFLSVLFDASAHSFFCEHQICAVHMTTRTRSVSSIAEPCQSEWLVKRKCCMHHFCSRFQFRSSEISEGNTMPNNKPFSSLKLNKDIWAFRNWDRRRRLYTCTRSLLLFMKKNSMEMFVQHIFLHIVSPHFVHLTLSSF